MKLLSYDRIPDRLFVKALKVRDIRKARVLTRKEKRKLKPGSPDVVLESPLGFSEHVPRDMFVKAYKYINGQKIKLSGWRGINKYLVMCIDNTPVYVMHIPPIYSVKIQKESKIIIANKTPRVRGDYIVCMANPDGTINREVVFTVTNLMYKKMFITSSTIEPLKCRPNKVNKPIEHQDRQAGEVEHGQTEVYKAIGKVVKNGKVIGFIIDDNTGHQITANKSTIMKLCSEKKVSNLCLVEQNGTYYLRGIGIKIEDLQTYMA